MLSVSPTWESGHGAKGGKCYDESTASAIIWKFPRQMWLCVRLWLTSLIYMPCSDTRAYGKKQEQERNDLLFALENKQANRS